MIARILVIIVLLSLELYAVYAVLHPRVSPEYRAHFIDHFTNDWHAPPYPATPEEGISFGKEGWPGFVKSAEGFALPEGWGRWTDAVLTPTAKITMNRQFSGPLCIQFGGHPSDAELGQTLQLALGQNVADIKLSQTDYAIYRVSFDQAKPADTLEFRLSKLPPPINDTFRRSPDGRRLGMALFWLKILPDACP
jgi:hypothetical protein